MTIFKDIINRKLPAEIVFENKNIIAIKDKYPIAPVHILIMPKKEIPNIQKMKKEDYFLLGEMMEVIQKLSEEYDIADGYRLLTNNGSNAGQTIFHLHFHLIGGKRLGPMG